MGTRYWLILGLLAALLMGCNGGDDDDDVTGDDDDVTGDDDDATGDDDDATGDDDDATGDDDDSAGVWGQEALDLITGMVGTYTGDFVMHGLDGADAPYPAMSWADTAVASNPRIDGDRAQVDVHDTMVMDGGGTYEQEWLEGILIEPDGSAGDRFIDMDGVVTVQTEVTPGVFEYEQPIEEYDFYNWTNVTAANLIAGGHLMHKEVVDDGGIETHLISRTTSLEYEDAGGSTVSVEYLSLEGTHQKSE